MSTRATVAFAAFDGEVMAAVYLHYNGWKVAEELQEFFAAVIADNPGVNERRFYDPPYLAAKYVAWLTAGRGLDFSGIGIITDPQRYHANRRYTVRCHRDPSGALPQVTEEER